MVASTIIVVASLPVYKQMFHTFDVAGLAMASDIGIFMHTVVLAWLLHRRKMVLLDELPWPELIKALVTAILAAVISYVVAGRVIVSGSRMADLAALALISATWLATVALGLWLTKSSLSQDLRPKNRKRIPAEMVPENPAGEMEP
jgi:peptidoglycan biosynthesis protein MviN/MurJ (putative lipid II flippase)